MLVADASNRGIGGYYGQGKDYKTMTPTGFHSRALNPAEKNYPTHDKEMLAIVDCIKKFAPQLTGIKFNILTDHAPLTHWKTQKDLSPRQVRWEEYYPNSTLTLVTSLVSPILLPMLSLVTHMSNPTMTSQYALFPRSNSIPRSSIPSGNRTPMTVSSGR